MLCGIDEAGRGPLAGPVYVAAVVLGSEGAMISGIDDSKKLSQTRREALAEEIKRRALMWSIVSVDVETIDQINILQATLRGMFESFMSLVEHDSIQHVVIDGTQLPKDLVAWASSRNVLLEARPKADATVKEVGAASILAKTARDSFMLEMDVQFPQYGFARHKGYGTAAHIAAIEKYGPCDLHRKSFAPIAQYTLL
jgi:ribonuclease HII